MNQNPYKKNLLKEEQRKFHMDSISTSKTKGKTVSTRYAHLHSKLIILVAAHNPKALQIPKCHVRNFTQMCESAIQRSLNKCNLLNKSSNVSL